MSVRPPVLRTTGAAAAARPAALLAALDEPVLAHWLSTRRWFAAKGYGVVRVTLHDAVPVEDAHVRAAVARLAVELDDGRVERYQLPVVLRERAAGGEAGAEVLVTVAGDGWQAELVDAVYDAGFRALVARGLEQGATHASGDVRWVLTPEPGAELAGLADMRSTPGGAEQSNTSLLYGDRAVLKLYRRLEGGEQPDVEMARYLSGLGDRAHVPPLLGTIRFEEGTGTTTVAGMLQTFVAGAQEGWALALASARAFLEGGDADARIAFAREARELGLVTRTMHAALAANDGDPAFAPVAATADDVGEWLDRARDTTFDAIELLASRRAANALPAAIVAIADAVLQRRAELLADLDALASQVGHVPGERIRHHGDLHLGQTLRGADGRWYVIDFEGEPQRPLAERRSKQSALRDVAGMLRSFSYAALVAAQGVGGLGVSAPVELGVARWERAMRDAFLDAYFGGGRAPFLPADPEGGRQLLALFEMEKVCYELHYELNNRPDWAWVPLRGIGRMLGARRPPRREPS